ncbi:MAG: hypothetical protein JRE70_17005 [Deltaproteobacteria bacterium]|nr:hypothetical protein [Deltaproteobacteria bacterium]
MSFPTVKYRDLDAGARTRQREAWNEPVLWPLYALIIIFVAVTVPGVVTFIRERQ